MHLELDQQKISKLNKSTKIENKSGRHILYYNGAKKTKDNISIVTLLQHFDDIFELHPSLEIENVCFRKHSGSLINLTKIRTEKQLTPIF